MDTSKIGGSIAMIIILMSGVAAYTAYYSYSVDNDPLSTYTATEIKGGRKTKKSKSGNRKTKRR